MKGQKLSVLIMLFAMVEFLGAVWLVSFMMKLSKRVKDIDSQVDFFKKGIIETILEYRVSLRMLNVQVKAINEARKVKQFFDALNALATFSLYLGLKKKF